MVLPPEQSWPQLEAFDWFVDRSVLGSMSLNFLTPVELFGALLFGGSACLNFGPFPASWLRCPVLSGPSSRRGLLCSLGPRCSRLSNKAGKLRQVYDSMIRVY